MLKIGDFSSLAQISVKTLRFYDELGLLCPSRVDSASGYRYYSVDLLPRLHRILALKDLGFPLDQIAKVLHENVTGDQLRGMLILREAEQQARVEEEQGRLARLQARLSLIEKENTMSSDVVIKELPPQWIASVREVIPSYPAVGRLYGTVVEALSPNMPTGIPVAIWHDLEFKEKDVDAEAGFYLKQPLTVAPGPVKVHELPSATVASIIQKGAYNRLSEAYDSLLRWIGSNGYRVAAPIRELYLQNSQPVRQDDESYVTEIQVPIAKQ